MVQKRNLAIISPSNPSLTDNMEFVIQDWSLRSKLPSNVAQPHCGSQVTGHRSQVTGHRSQVTGHYGAYLGIVN